MKKVTDVETLPMEWRDGRCYAVVSTPGTYKYRNKTMVFASPGEILLYSMRPDDWTET